MDGETMKVMIIAPPEVGRFARVVEKLEKPMRYLLYSMTFSVCAATLFGVRWSILTTRKDRDRNRSKDNRDKDRDEKITEVLEKMVEDEQGDMKNKKKKLSKPKEREISHMPTKSGKSGDGADPLIVRRAD